MVILLRSWTIVFFSSSFSFSRFIGFCLCFCVLFAGGCGCGAFSMSADDIPPASVVEVHGVVGGGDGLGAFFGSVEADGLCDSVGIVFAFPVASG